MPGAGPDGGALEGAALEGAWAATGAITPRQNDSAAASKVTRFAPSFMIVAPLIGAPPVT